MQSYKRSKIVQICIRITRFQVSVLQRLQNLVDSWSAILPYINEFNDIGRSHSETFLFWDNYLSMVELLLNYIAAERISNFSVHIESFCQMLPWDFAYDHTNYARWGSLYCSEMLHLPNYNPEFFTQCELGNHMINRLKCKDQSFNNVWTDMGIEKSMNSDCGVIGGLTGIATNTEALHRLCLTSHLRASVTYAFKTNLCGLGEDDRNYTHKEATTNRISKDATQMVKIVSTVTERMINPFQIMEQCDTNDTEDMPLLNIATGSFAPQEIADDLQKAKEIGKNQFEKFVEKLINSNEKDFYKAVTSNDLTTFASLEKNSKAMSKSKQKPLNVNVYRQLFGRSLVISKDRDVDVMELFSYELSSVPLSLFNFDGSMVKCNKSKLLEELEKGQETFETLPDEVKPGSLTSWP